VSDAKHDAALGMKRRVTRRDFMNGASIAVGATLALSRGAWGKAFGLPAAPLEPSQAGDYYPPAKTGLRGSHDGSWEVAHSLRDGKHWDSPTPDSESYDLIIVGGGISGLAAAYFYRQQAGPKSRVLILENHDDFGGHAKRNEFHSGGRLLIGYGGTQSIAGPRLYSPEAKGLFKDLGIEFERFEKYFDQKFFASRGLSHGYFFDK
jgi:spermidine dehydrogenase